MSKSYSSSPRPPTLALAVRPLLTAYSVLLTAALIATTPFWLFRIVATGRYREGLLERLGFVPARVPARGPAARPGEIVIWLHAVSVGEVLAAARLVHDLRGRGRRVFLSTTTRTGQALARERFGAETVFYYPLDFAFAVRAWLRYLRPDIIILMESEFWPRMLVECARSAIPVVVVNARISDRSWPRYQRLQRLWRPLLQGLTATLAQSEGDAKRLRALGAAQVETAGNLKFDVKPEEEAVFTVLLREHLPPDAKVVVCGSTLEGEEALLLAALTEAAPAALGPQPILIFAPRHPERSEGVAGLLSRAGRPFIRRSLWHPGPIEPGTVILLDSIGELASVYSLADLACIGGSWFPPGGGHNPLEPALLGVPVVTGPYTANFAVIVALLQSKRAIVVASERELAGVVRWLMTDKLTAAAIGGSARDVAEGQAGATARTLAVIDRVLVERKP